MRTAWLIGDQKHNCPDPTKVDITLRSLKNSRTIKSVPSGACMTRGGIIAAGWG